jgi:hypothetical protein
VNREYQIEKAQAMAEFQVWAKENAYATPEAVDARNMLYKLHDELMRSNPSAADLISCEPRQIDNESLSMYKIAPASEDIRKSSSPGTLIRKSP